MGSKSSIMHFVLDGINEVYSGGAILDLFSGSASLAGSVGQQCAVHSNDIQSYSLELSKTYSLAYKNKKTPTADCLLSEAALIVKKNKAKIKIKADYFSVDSIAGFNIIETLQKELIDRDFRHDWHLFLKYYSGTWWSMEQCLWIDAIREVAETYKDTTVYSPIISSLMFAMAYTSQGTGHYAQYRDAKTQSSLEDILIYRKRLISKYFKRKYDELIKWLPNNKPKLNHKITTLDYLDCIHQFKGGTVYADPPYCFVHYSRFYHTLETLVLYDYPKLQIKNGKIVKGRYRENRHQSPFCIKSQVKDAFLLLFEAVKDNESSLVLSYSNTGMISLEELKGIAETVFKKQKINLLFKKHKHMTLGRQKDKDREVKECLLIIK